MVGLLLRRTVAVAVRQRRWVAVAVRQQMTVAVAVVLRRLVAAVAAACRVIQQGHRPCCGRCILRRCGRRFRRCCVLLRGGRAAPINGRHAH